MLKQYSNINQIKSARKSTTAQRLPQSKEQIISVLDKSQTYAPNTNITNDNVDNRVEFHIYSDDTWVSGNHKISLQNNNKEFRDKITNRTIRINNGIGIDIYQQFEDLQITSGNFTIVLNFFKNLIGSFERQHLRIDEISPDRKEIRLRAIDSQDVEFYHK